MNKTLLALAALTAFAGVASAQSSVTVFGIVDLAAQSVKTGNSTKKLLTSNGNSTSRFGFRGVEDLGGGMKAGFWLESQLGADTGVAGGSNGSGGSTSAMWNRRATASLMGNFGEIRLGRDYTPTFWNHTTFDVFGTNGVANSNDFKNQTLGSAASTFVRANNTIGYHLPSLGGIYGQVMLAAGEGVAGNKFQGGRFGYAAGPVNVAVAFGKTETATNNDFKETNVGGSFNAGFMTVMGQYSNRKYGAVDQKTWVLGGLVPMGAGTFKVSFGKSTGSSGIAGDDSKLLGLGYVYDLSKRTAVYAHYGKLDFTNNAKDRTGYEFGLKHAF